MTKPRPAPFQQRASEPSIERLRREWVNLKAEKRSLKKLSPTLKVRLPLNVEISRRQPQLA